MKTWTQFVYIILVIIISPCVQAQMNPLFYGDEWIVENQSYYKFTIDKNGIYRISASDLKDVGISLDQVEGRRLQIFSLGKEVPIRTSSQGVFDESDFIEFYGEKNDGSIDGLLYAAPAVQQLNPYISLYSNERPYFLTWSKDESSIQYSERSNGMESNGLPPQEPYYMHREIIQYDEFHHKPTHDGRNFIRYSSMDYSEGYGSELESARTISIPVDKLSPFGVDPKIIMRFGTNVHSINWRIYSDSRQLKIVPRKGYGVSVVDERFPLEDLKEGNFNVHLESISGENAKSTIARIELHYPRKYEFDGDVEIIFHQQASILSRYIEIKGFGGIRPILYNLTDRIIVYPEQEGDIIRFITPAAYEEHKWILVDQELAVNSVSNLKYVDLQGVQNIGDYLILSHGELIASGAVQEYADYRASDDGGGYDVTVVNISQLINRYSFGIEGHPISIKNMMRDLRDRGKLPKYTFIIGKGREYTDIKEGKVNHPLVPTFGIPGSDNLLLAFGDNRYPEGAVGRLAATSAQDVINYLNKIRAHEDPIGKEQTKKDQAWKKEVIHLSGGSAGNQATLFRFLNDMGEVLTYNTFGADIFTFRKTTADPIERASAENIMNRIDQGASLLTFFGHSAVGTFDFSLEDPSKYQNAGRNPVILSLGCHSGNIHTAGSGISEDFILEKDRGAIAFIASSGTAYPQPQYDTGIDFYNLLGGEMYGLPIGDIIQRSLEARADNPSLSVQTLIEQLTLHGDPAYRLGSFKGPDFIIDDASVVISPGILDATSQSFNLTFDVLNLGAVLNDVLDIEVVHALPDDSSMETQVISIPAPSYSATISIDLNNPGVNWIGSNRLHITVDAKDEIPESPHEKAEKNNIYFGQDGEEGVEFFVFDNSAKPIIPSDFGIVSTAPFVLRSSVNNGLNPGGKFILQIDTTEYFNSPLFSEETIDNVSSIIDWQPDISSLPNVVYYWRIAPITEQENLKARTWQSSSFIYLPESPAGWNQSHFFQWQKDDYYKMVLEEGSRTFHYDERLWDIRIKNEIRTEGDFWVYVNNTPWASLNPRNRGSLLSIFAWDRQNVIYKNSGSDYGSIPFSSDGFIYEMNSTEDIINVITLLNSLPENSRVFFHTMLEDEEANLNTSLWDDPLGPPGQSLMDLLESFGALKARELIKKGTVPYTFIFDKGQSMVVEDIANNILETIDLSSTARSIWPEGTVTSVPISRSGRWLRLLWEEEKEDEDDTSLFVLGIKPGGMRDTLKRIENDYSVNLTSIDPLKYPKIELVYNTADALSKTAPQLKYWRILSNPLPDAAFYTQAESFEIRDTVNAGEPLILNFDLLNLTDVGMGPVLIRYTLIDQDYNEKITLSRAQGLPGKDTINILESISTDHLEGNYQVVVEINPRQEQDELTDCNNLGFANFYVRPDRRNPFLDVTFDGRHINNGERISSRPEIVISLRDENSFLLLDNPEDFEMTLYYPSVFEWRIDQSSPVVQWMPASSLDDNKASFVIRPNLNQEGLYTLEVQGKDIAGNLAGSQTYRITFEISTSGDFPKLTVSPNPMTYYTDFEYYLDSDFIPDIFNVYVYTADGKFVKHIKKSDFGGLKRGLNTYRWYGVTDYGELLTTGLYYYEFVNNVDNRKEKQKGSVLMVRE